MVIVGLILVEIYIINVQLPFFAIGMCRWSHCSILVVKNSPKKDIIACYNLLFRVLSKKCTYIFCAKKYFPYEKGVDLTNELYQKLIDILGEENTVPK